MDFSKITPCGGNCTDCGHFISGECKGCLSKEGRCVTLWNGGCEIFACCKRHNVKFCGLCGDFPCHWLQNKIGQWDKDGIKKLKELKEIYERENT
ncbi:MAG: DUF3795 domain-containing protein [Ruminiclostridium sp.]|nr:DUF3795 domain-containing protein [Ruminiclostridium sp.]